MDTLDSSAKNYVVDIKKKNVYQVSNLVELVQILKNLCRMFLTSTMKSTKKNIKQNGKLA